MSSYHCIATEATVDAERVVVALMAKPKRRGNPWRLGKDLDHIGVGERVVQGDLDGILSISS